MDFSLKYLLKQQWTTVAFVTQDRVNFHEIFKVFVVIDQKICGV